MTSRSPLCYINPCTQQNDYETINQNTKHTSKANGIKRQEDPNGIPRRRSGDPNDILLPRDRKSVV